MRCPFFQACFKIYCGAHPSPTLTNVAWQKKHKAANLLYYVAQLAPNSRGLCSFSSVPVSCTAAHESPLCGESSLGSVTEPRTALMSPANIRSRSDVTNLDLLHTWFVSCFVLVASPQPVLRLAAWIKRVRQHVLILREIFNVIHGNGAFHLVICYHGLWGNARLYQTERGKKSGHMQKVR